MIKSVKPIMMEEDHGLLTPGCVVEMPPVVIDVDKVYVVIDCADFGDSYSECVVGAYLTIDAAEKKARNVIKECIRNYKIDQRDLNLEKAKIFDLRKKIPINEMIKDKSSFCYIDGSIERDSIKIIEVEVRGNP